MKRVVIAVAAVLSLVVALTAFAIEGIQPAKETGINFEQMKADHLKKLDERVLLKPQFLKQLYDNCI